MFPVEEKVRQQKLKWARLAADRLACESVCRFLLNLNRGEACERARYLHAIPGGR
ncbi:MAG: hypothetical protein KIT79_14030 [Deltaproteobacteria bacterium]|nr:hypothetical protein [Deltaproteobacteria bacterium]